MNLAFTIGNRSSYDRALTEGPVSKLGRSADYEGGWVWRTSEEAQAFIDKQGAALGFLASVYELKLPSGWDKDVSQEPSPDDGVHRLLHDALITNRVQVLPASA